MWVGILNPSSDLQIYRACFWKWDRHRHRLLSKRYQEKLFLLHFRIRVCLCIGVRFVFIGQTFTYSTRLVLHGRRGAVCGNDTRSSSVQRMLLDWVSLFHWMRRRGCRVLCFPSLYIPYQQNKSHFVKSVELLPLNHKERGYRRIPCPTNQLWILHLFSARPISLIHEEWMEVLNLQRGTCPNLLTDTLCTAQLL